MVHFWTLRLVSIYSFRVLFCFGSRYNGRSIVFIVTFCLSTLYIAIMLFILNKVQYGKYVDGTEDYAQCLVEASIRSPNQSQEGVDAYAQHVCGDYPSVRPNKYEVGGSYHHILSIYAALLLIQV